MGKKVRTTLTIDHDVLNKAKEIGLNVSQYCENCLKDAIERLERPKSGNASNNPVSKKQEWTGGISAQTGSSPSPKSIG